MTTTTLTTLTAIADLSRASLDRTADAARYWALESDDVDAPGYAWICAKDAVRAARLLAEVEAELSEVAA
jgi:hypothetical protein